ncbi:molybdopterin-dependent oxidoreductase [Acidobacterium sp. S8]|uniref:molybdopterin-containing oxidoreductase family protein n=1 Tax=Acidobacterium sp. S8 TaxID=1641854 RepID=UPI00131C3920|nr:molybdopterin-dependent oxidoreductase [Acidobacterium sp. S8]
MPPVKTVHTVCSHDCPDSCAVLVTIDETGRATRVQGDPSHPVTQGFLCGKVAKYLDRVYSPDRLLYPMRRRVGVAKGPLPQGKETEAFERISWNEALDTMATRLQKISDEHGPESILPYSYAGTIGTLGYGSMDRRFFHRLGASQLDRTICSTAGGDALLAVYGRKLGTDTEHFRHSRYIIAWGANVHGNNVHLWPIIEEARRLGAKLIVIDPYKTRTAKAADWHIAINPGTDVALALGMMHVILRDGLEDADYITGNTHGFAELKQRAAEYTPTRVSAWTGIPAADIERLAREYATTTPAVIRMNYGIQRGENGGTAARTVAMLPALIGAWKHLGGGLQLSTSGAFAWDKAAIERPELMLASPLKRHARIVNMSELGHALTELNGPPVKALFVYNSNPAAIAPDQAQVLRGMAREDLFTVVHEQFFTDTADYADIVLPATTFLEHKDIQGAYGHYYVQISNQAIEPLGESRSNVWLFSQLAQRMGFAESCFLDTPENLIAQALGKQDKWMAGVTEETLNAAGGRQRLQFDSEKNGQPFLPFVEGPFATPSGKVEFYSETLGAKGLDPLPGFVPPAESRHTEKAKFYPLEFLPRKADNYMNSTFANLPGHQRMEAAFTNHLEIHADDAMARSIAEGDTIEIFNDRGSLRMTAHFNGSLPRGVVAGRLNWNKLSPGGNNVNLLTSQRLTDFGGGPTFYSTLVEVRKA